MERSTENKQNGFAPHDGASHSFGNNSDDLRADLTHTREAFHSGKDFIKPLGEELQRAKQLAAQEALAAKRAANTAMAKMRGAAKTVGASMQRAGKSVISTMKKNKQPMLIGSGLLVGSGLLWLIFRNRKVQKVAGAVLPAIIKLARPIKTATKTAAVTATAAKAVGATKAKAKRAIKTVSRRAAKVVAQ